ncbi:MAG: sigma-54 dependent transcriptional regulator [Ignavibacteriaceae bacterium]|nr:sigma-54 dependent transcriptional regulator [Ignavibacteriaceae bacterium]
MDKILIIDDDPNIRETLKVLLSKEYKVILAENGITGIQKFKSESPDLIITDLKMDDYDGIQILKKVKELNNDIPVILITAYEDIRSSIDAVQFGAYDYIGKPLDIEKFKICVKRALNCKKLNDKIYNIVSQGIDEYQSAFNFVAETPSMKHIVKNVGHVAMSRMNVLIQGESGTGKELIAKLIHYSGVTKNSPFIAVNCSALTDTILESELFGHVKGAFTNADRDKKGKFELAGDGTLFLDEVSEISLCNQVKLLRVIQAKEFEKVGGEETIPFNGRIITATNKNLKDLVQKEKFREDLYFRLKVFMIEIPPLRERKEVIPSLVTFLINKINRELHKNIRKVPFDVMEILMNYQWVGNIRELENTLYQAMVLSTTDVLEKENILLPGRFTDNTSKNRAGMSIAEVEKEHIKLVLESTNGNKHKTCEILGISMGTLYNKIAEYNF